MDPVYHDYYRYHQYHYHYHCHFHRIPTQVLKSRKLYNDSSLPKPKSLKPVRSRRIPTVGSSVITDGKQVRGRRELWWRGGRQNPANKSEAHG